MQAQTQEVDWGGAFQYIMDRNSAVFVGGSGGNFFEKFTLNDAFWRHIYTELRNQAISQD